MARKTQKPLLAKIRPDHAMFGIIEDAYRVFAGPKPVALEVCEGCCMEAEIEADFFRPDIEDLPLHYLRDWFFAACDPKGVSKGLWRYLLPRILEVLAVGEEPASVGMEVSLYRYRTGVADNWSDAEWDVLDRFQRAYLARAILGEDASDFLDDTLCMFGIAGWPAPDLTAQVAEFPDDVLARRFWADWCRGRPSVWINAFWDGGGNSEVFAFYTSRALYDRMVGLMIDPATPEELVAKAANVASVIEANADWNAPR